MNRISNIILGCFITGVGTILLQHAHLVVGGTAGLSLSLSYLFHLPFSLVFFIVNIPFYIFAVLRMGWNFTIATFFAITTMSCITGGMEWWLADYTLAPWIGTVAGGGLAGLGLSILFINQSSLGGANILALYLEKKYCWNPGFTNFIFDGIVVLLGVYSAGLLKGIYSVITVVIISAVIGRLKGGEVNRNNSVKTVVEPQME